MTDSFSVKGTTQQPRKNNQCDIYTDNFAQNNLILVCAKSLINRHNVVDLGFKTTIFVAFYNVVQRWST